MAGGVEDLEHHSIETATPANAEKYRPQRRGTYGTHRQWRTTQVSPLVALDRDSLYFIDVDLVVAAIRESCRPWGAVVCHVRRAVDLKQQDSGR